MQRNRTPWLMATAGMATVALLAAGCSSDTGDGTGATDSDAKITLTVATFNEFGYEDLITEYMELNPNITVEQKKAATGNEARDNLNTRLAAGSGLSDVEAIEVDYNPLPAILSTADSNAPETPRIWEDCENNESLFAECGNSAAVDAAIAAAHHVVRDRFVVNRVAACTMEPRAVVRRDADGHAG